MALVPGRRLTPTRGADYTTYTVAVRRPVVADAGALVFSQTIVSGHS
jgi:hypothetical protein